MPSFKERAEQFRSKKSSEQLVREASVVSGQVAVEIGERSERARKVFQNAGYDEFLDKGLIYLQSEVSADATLVYDKSTRTDHRWENDLDPLSTGIATAEYRWGILRGDVQDGFSFVRVELNMDGTGRVIADGEIHVVNVFDRDNLEQNIVEAVFNPGRTFPLNGPHPDNIN